MSRKKARKEVMITMYQMDINDAYNYELQAEKLKERITDIHELDYAKNIIKEFLKDKDMVDDHIRMNLTNWHITRLPKVDLAILRLAITEFFYFEDIPIEVSINEAIEMAKEFSDDESAKFINGVLGGVVAKGNLINE